ANLYSNKAKIIFSSGIFKLFNPSNSTKSNVPNPPGIKLINPDNAPMINIPINTEKYTCIPTINNAIYNTAAEIIHSILETMVQYIPVNLLSLFTGFQFVIKIKIAKNNATTYINHLTQGNGLNTCLTSNT